MVMRMWLYAAAVAAVALAASAGEAGDSLVYRTPRGVEFEVTADGLSAIRVAGRPLAQGGWSAFNAEGWFKAGTGAVKAEKIDRKECFKQTGPAN
jgi:hypothetical protein